MGNWVENGGKQVEYVVNWVEYGGGALWETGLRIVGNRGGLLWETGWRIVGNWV